MPTAASAPPARLRPSAAIAAPRPARRYPAAMALLCLPALPFLVFSATRAGDLVSARRDPDATRWGALCRVREHPRDPEARIKLAQMGAPLEAITHLSVAVKLRPHDPRAWRDMGDAHRALRDYPEAARNYRRAISLGLRDAATLHGLGDALLRSHGGDRVARAARAAAAIEPLREAADLTPRDPAPLLTLAEAYLRSGRTREGQETLRRAIAAGPGTRAGLRAARRLERLDHPPILPDPRGPAASGEADGPVDCGLGYDPNY